MMNTLSKSVTVAFLFSVLHFPSAQAAVTTQAEVAAEPSTLASRPTDLAATVWKPEKSWAGDLRYRVHVAKDGINDQRIYQQIRARLAYRADIEDNLTAILRLATAASAISANQTLGDSTTPGMQRRAFGLDQAYLDYKPATDLRVWLGKTPNPFYSAANNQLIFDSDIDFEGLSAKWFGEAGGFKYFANAGTSMISENYAAGIDSPDSALVGLQVGGSIEAFGTFTAAVSSYNYLNVQGRPATSIAASPAVSGGRFGGNSLSGANLASEFKILQASLSWRHTWESFQSEVFYDALQNSVGQLGRGAYETGFVAKRGPWSVSYAFVFKESDSTLGAFSDSDSNGGGTDNNGTRANITYQISKTVSASITDFRAKRSISANAPSDFGDTMFDIAAAF